MVVIMSSLEKFSEFLSANNNIAEKHRPYFIYWVKLFLAYEKEAPQDQAPTLDGFLHQLAKCKEEWQVDQARKSIRLYRFFVQQSSSVSHGQDNDWSEVMTSMRRILRLKHRALRTEKVTHHGV